MIKNNKIEIFFVNLISAIPILMVTGPFLPDLVVVVSCLYFIFSKLQSGDIKIFKNKFFIFFLIFWFYLILNSIITDNSLHSLKSSIPFIRFGIFSLFVFYLLSKNYNLEKKLFNVLSLVFLILFIDGFIQFIFGKNLIGLPLPLEGRISSFFGDESKMGSFIARLLPFYVALSFLILKNNEKKIIFLNSVLLLAPIIIILSGERMSLVIYFIFLVLIFDQLKDKIKILLTITLILIINFNFNKDFVIRYISSPFLYQDKAQDLIFFDFKKIKEENKKIFLDRNFTIFTPYYHSHFISAFLMFKDSPIIGQGANTFRIKCNEFDFKIHDKSCTTHPHNLNLQLLAELGFIGYLFYLFFLYFLIKKIFFNYNKDKFSYDLNLNFFFVVNLFPLISSGNFFNNWHSILFFLPLGFLINNHYKVKK
jgi:hypothetical protein